MLKVIAPEREKKEREKKERKKRERERNKEIEKGKNVANIRNN